MQPARVLTVKDLGQQIRRFRRQRGLTQGQLAAQLGATQHWISEIESGKDGTPIGSVFRVMAHLGMQVHVLDRLAPASTPDPQQPDDLVPDLPSLDELTDDTSKPKP